MTKHVHAELMALYAQDALETDKPWERWEVYRSRFLGWGALSIHPMWFPDVVYRRKPMTININGYEVPEPCKENLDQGQRYWIPRFTCINHEYTFILSWCNDAKDLTLLKNGMVHTTKEAAAIHAKALMSFTKE